MSSTNRGALRHPDDYYATPAWSVDAIMPHLPGLREARILEPAAGDGAIVRALRLHGVEESQIEAVELDEERAAFCRMSCPTVCGDFLKLPVPDGPSPSLVVMNPPYSLAQEFIERAMRWLTPGGTCAVLLRLPFACSAKRRAFRAAHPFDVFALASRPSFGLNKDGEPGTDSADYAWFLFGEGRGGRFKVLENEKPKAARRPGARKVVSA